MGALTLVVLVTLLGACACGLAGWRLAQVLGEDRRERIARWAVALLAACGGGQIAAQLYDLVHELQLNAAFHFSGGDRSANAITVLDAFRGVLFDGFLLLGLAAAIGLLALRLAPRARLSAAPQAPPPLADA